MISFFPPCPRIYTLSRLVDTRALPFSFFRLSLSLLSFFLFFFSLAWKEAALVHARRKWFIILSYIHIYIYVYTIYNERETVKQDLTVCSRLRRRRKRRRDEYSLGKETWMRDSVSTIEPSFFLFLSYFSPR